MSVLRNKKNLILVHGLLGSLTYFQPEIRLPAVNLFAPEMHGYGGTRCLVNLSLYDQAEWIKEYIRTQVKGAFWLLGHSVGGAVATIIAAEIPQYVEGIINVEGNFTLNDAFWCRQIALKPPDMHPASRVNAT